MEAPSSTSGTGVTLERKKKDCIGLAELLLCLLFSVKRSSSSRGSEESLVEVEVLSGSEDTFEEYEDAVPGALDAKKTKMAFQTKDLGVQWQSPIVR